MRDESIKRITSGCLTIIVVVYLLAWLIFVFTSKRPPSEDPIPIERIPAILHMPGETSP